jgi:hypothetical protein
MKKWVYINKQKESIMTKLKTLTNLAKVNHKLGLLDAGDVVKLATTAYKVKHFDPKDHLPDWEIFEDEEYERSERRKNLLIAGAAAGTAYWLYKNGPAIREAVNETKSLEAENDRGEEIIDDVADKSKRAYRDVKEKGEDIADDAKAKGEKAKDKAIDKGSDIAKDVSDKAKDAEKDIKKLK